MANPLIAATLIAIFCHPVGPGTENCRTETIVGKVQAPEAGKVDDPIPMPEMSLVQCTVLAQRIISEWVKLHPEYQMWELRGWQCPTPEALPSHKA